VMIHNRDTRG